MKNIYTFRRSIVMLIISSFSYVLMHFIFDLGSFPLFKGIIGPKNFLPVSMGMILGPFGSFGMVAGALAGGVLSKASIAAIIAESAGAVIMSGGGWLLWYARKGTGGIVLKRVRDLVRFTVISVILSCVCGFIAYLYGLGFIKTFASYLAWNLLMGIPIIMLMTSVICVNVVYPSWHRVIFDINILLPLETSSIAIIREKIDELCENGKLDRTRGYQMYNSIEECFSLILSEPSCRELRLVVKVSDSISIVMQYDGKVCNPLKKRVYEDTLGRELIRNRDLRVRHRYTGKKNHLHIVQ
jgi:hypothetical protein